MNTHLKRLKFWLFPMILTVLMLAVFLPDELFSEPLSFQRLLIVNGEYWRLLTAHIVHLNDTHLYLNLVGLWFICFLVGDRFKPIEWLALVLVLAFIVSLGLITFNPYLEHYVGFSGVLHGLLIAGLLKEFNTYAEKGLLILVALKLFYEQVFGPFSGSTELISGHIIVDAHFYGAIAGMSYIFFRSIVTRKIVESE